MSNFKLHQGNITAALSEIDYQTAKGFQEDNTWHVAEETMTAESSAQLQDGPATILHGGMEFPVIVSVLKFEASSDDQDDEINEDGPACIIDIGFAEGLTKLAAALGIV